MFLGLHGDITSFNGLLLDLLVSVSESALRRSFWFLVQAVVEEVAGSDMQILKYAEHVFVATKHELCGTLFEESLEIMQYLAADSVELVFLVQGLLVQIFHLCRGVYSKSSIFYELG